LHVVAPDRGDVVLARLVDEEGADAISTKSGVDQFTARPVDFFLGLKMACDNCGHAVLLPHWW
jgi:hypothetical protein